MPPISGVRLRNLVHGWGLFRGRERGGVDQPRQRHPDTWLPVHGNNFGVPPGVNSAFFLLVINITAGEGVGWFDDVYFGPDPLTPVELQGFRVE